MMSRHHQRRFTSFDGTHREGPPRGDRLIIEPTLWFVDQKQRRTSSDGPSERQAPLLPVRQRRGLTVKQRGQPERIDNGADIVRVRISEHQIARHAAGKQIRR